MENKIKEIVFPNRYRNTVKLRKTGVDWTLESNAYYYRLAYNDDGSIYMYDPEGGPALFVGSKVKDYVIKSIKEINGEFVFTLEDGVSDQN